MVQLKDKTFEVLLPHLEIGRRVRALAEQINQDYQEKCPLFVAVLNGSFMFAADLLKNIDIPCEITFVKLTSYEGTQRSNTLTQLVGLREGIAGRHVIIIEDIVDSGITIEQVLADVKQKNPQSVRVATLLLKPEALEKPVAPEYVGFEIANKFVVGYGLDYDGLGRNLPDIYALKAD